MRLALPVVAITCGSISQAFADEGKFQIEGATFKVAPSKSKIESIASYDTDGDGFTGTRIGIKATIPAQEIAGGAQSELDEFSETWALGPSFAQEWKDGLANDRNSTEYLLAFAPQWSFRRFAYLPDLENEVFKIKHSFIADLRGQIHRVNTATELKLRYEREWQPEDEVGVVTSATPPAPAVVEESVIRDAPTVTPSFLVRAFHWRRIGDGPVAIGPSAAVMTKGEKGVSWSPASETVIVRLELWGFFTPANIKPANFRIGLAPYVDVYAKGESDTQSDYDAGLLFQARVGTDIFSY